jgi:chaperonin GroES
LESIRERAIRIGFRWKDELPMKIVPIGENVMVKRMAPEVVTAGGIVLPDTAQEKPWQGRVLSVGDGRLLPDGRRIPHQVSEGDRVLFGRYAGTEVVVNGEDLLIMNETDILAVVP